MASLQEIEQALRAADAAGDTEAAQRLAAAYVAMRGDSAPKADFSNVKGAASTVPAMRMATQPYAGPLLAPSRNPLSDNAPTLGEINTANARYRNSPQAAQDAQRLAAQDAALQRADFQSLPAPLRFGIGAGAAVDKAGRGAGQLYALGHDAAMGGNLYAQALQDEAQARTDQRYMDGDTAASLGKFAGDVAMVAGLPASRLSQGGALLRYGGNAAMGAGLGLLQPVTADESRTQNGIVGGAFGAGGQAAGDVANILGTKASAAGRQLYDLAKAHGIDLTPSQVTDSPFVRTMASALNKLPFSGGMGVMKRQQEGFNRAVGRTFGADAGKLTDDVMGDAAKRHGQAYDALFARNRVVLDDAAINRLGQIEQEASNLTPEHAAVVRKQITDAMNLAHDGAIPGPAYQAFRVDRLRKLEESHRATQPFLAGLLRDIRGTLEDAAARSFQGDDAAALKALNREYANRKVAEKALKQVAGAEGNVRPAALWPIVNQKRGSTSEMRDLARLGQGIKDSIPDSGTAQRMMMYHALGNLAAVGGGGYAAQSDNPLVRDVGLLALGGAVGGRALNSRKLAGLLVRDGRGQAAQRLAPLLPYAGLASSPLLQEWAY